MTPADRARELDAATEAAMRATMQAAVGVARLAKSYGVDPRAYLNFARAAWYAHRALAIADTLAAK